VLLPFLGYLYSLSVRYIKAASGRQRFSVLGALNAVTKELVMITEHAYINATSVCALLEKLHEQFYDLPIVLIMDNARYQRCQLVLEKAKSLNIQIIFLPPVFYIIKGAHLSEKILSKRSPPHSVFSVR